MISRACGNPDKGLGMSVNQINVFSDFITKEHAVWLLTVIEHHKMSFHGEIKKIIP